jgi:hypothetical protein
MGSTIAIVSFGDRHRLFSAITIVRFRHANRAECA